MIKLVKLSSKFRQLIYSRTVNGNMSLMKDNIMKIMTFDCKNLSELYNACYLFENTLNNQQTNKYKQMLKKLEKKIKKMLLKSTNENQNSNKIDINTLLDNFPKIPLQGSPIYILIYRIQLDILKNSLENYQSISNLFISKFIARFVENDVQNYCSLSFHNQLKEQYQFYELILKKFNAFEQYFSKNIFKGYGEFKYSTANKIFKKQRVYKGQFQFQLDNSALNAQSSKNQIIFILQNISKFALLSDKYLLAAQLLLKQAWKQLSDVKLCSLCKIMSICGRNVKVIDENLVQLYQKIKRNQHAYSNNQNIQNYQNLLYYVITSNSENMYLIQSLTNFLNTNNHLVVQKYNQFTPDWYLAKLTEAILKNKYQQILIKKNYKSSNKNSTFLSLLTNKIQIFLSKNGFNYIATKCMFTQLPLYKFPNKSNSKFNPIVLCSLPPIFYNISSIDQNNKIQYSPNGINKLLKECYQLSSQKEGQKQIIKSINIAKMWAMEKKTNNDYYLETKLKGVERIPPIVKKIFDF